MSQESAVATDGARQENAPVFRYPVGDQGGVQGFLRVVFPNQLPSEVAHGQSVVVFHAESARVVERAVAHHGDHLNSKRRRDGEGLKRVHPAHAAASAENARPNH